MGIDATVQIETSIHFAPSDIPALHIFDDLRLYAISNNCNKLYEAHSGYRYYAPGYERGNWPNIAADLMVLLALPGVTAVWYYGDHTGEDSTIERGRYLMTVERLNEITAHYVKHERARNTPKEPE